MAHGLRRAVPLFLLMFAGGCGSGSPGGAELAKPVSFPPVSSTGNGLTAGTTPSQPTSATLNSNQVRLTLQLPTKLASSGSPVRRNLVVVKPTAIRLVKVNTALQVLNSYNISTDDQSDGSVIVTIPKGTFDRVLPKGPEYVFEVDADTTAGPITVMAPAADNNQDIKANPFSEYLVKRLFTTFSSTEISQLENCLSTQNLCVNGFVWPSLNDQAQDFEINIPDTVDEAGAMDFLANRADFTNFIADMKKTLLLPQSNLTTAVIAGTFNVLMFAPELDAAYQTDGSSLGQWGLRTQTRAYSTDSNGASVAQDPTLSFASTSVLGLNITSLSSDVPYARVTQLVQSATQYTFLDTSNWQTNTHSTGSSAAGVSNNDVLAGRSLLQSITNTGTDNATGWAPNPYFMDAYLLGGQASTTALVNSFFHAGKAIHLTLTNNSYERGKTLEDDNVAGLEMSIISPTGTETVTPATLDSHQYNTVELAMNLTGTNASPIVVTGRLASWSVSGGGITETPDNQTVMKRNNTGTVVAPTDSTGASTTYTVTNTSDDTSGTSGRLKIRTANGTVQSAAAAPDGSVLAMTLEGSADGRGLLVALTQTASQPALSGRTYRLQGVSIGLENDDNILDQINHATLTFSGSGTADLNFSATHVDNTISTGAVSAPTTTAYTGSGGTVTQTSTGKVTVTFASPASDGKNLSIEGYSNGDGSFLVLKVVHGNSIGLFFGYPQ